jgi:hypothetical protein
VLVLQVALLDHPTVGEGFPPAGTAQTRVAGSHIGRLQVTGLDQFGGLR